MVLSKRKDSDENMDWTISKHELHGLETIIGSGRFGMVKTQQWRGTKVALKSFLEECDFDPSTCINEFKIMTFLHHPNIVQTLGFVESPFQIVMEYVKGYNLEQLLDSRTYINGKTRMFITRQVLQGLAYLHGRKPEFFIHRDLKPTNILLQMPGYIVKLTDFGVSKMLRKVRSNHSIDNNIETICKQEDMTQCVGTLRYMAPEVYNENNATVYTHKIDIWSFAMATYYTWEGIKPQLPICDDTCTITQYRSMLLDGVRPQFVHTPKVLRAIISRAWKLDPDQRPDALECIQYLDEAKTSHFMFYDIRHLLESSFGSN